MAGMDSCLRRNDGARWLDVAGMEEGAALVDWRLRGDG